MTNALRRFRRALSGAGTENRPTYEPTGSRSAAADSHVRTRYPLA